jgi:hypothetical protein
MTASVPRLCRSAARSAPSAPRSNVCPQLRNLDGFNLGISNTEDCLYLNVFTQVDTRESTAAVRLWSGFTPYRREAKDYNTSKLVTQGDVIAPKGRKPNPNRSPTRWWIDHRRRPTDAGMDSWSMLEHGPAPTPPFQLRRKCPIFLAC